MEISIKKDMPFFPSEILDGIYDILDEFIEVASNDDIFNFKATYSVLNYLEHHPEVKHVTYSIVEIDEQDSLFTVAWTEKYREKIFMESFFVRRV